MAIKAVVCADSALGKMHFPRLMRHQQAGTIALFPDSVSKGTVIHPEHLAGTKTAGSYSICDQRGEIVWVDYNGEVTIRNA